MCSHLDASKYAPFDPQSRPATKIHRSGRFRGKCPDARIGSNPGLLTPNAGRCPCGKAIAAVTSDLSKFGSGPTAWGRYLFGPDVLTEGLVIMQNRERLRPWPVL